MARASKVKPTEVVDYEQLDLHQLEALLANSGRSTSDKNKHDAKVIRQAIHQRQRWIKAQVMAFEQTNNQHLLLFDSTENFAKFAGNSVLFYTMTIADRLHRRFNVKNDSDNYSPSDEGIVSIRSRTQLEAQLATINIFPDQERSTSELHFYRLEKIYTDEQIAKLRDRSERDTERIALLISPQSPVPELHQLILDLNRKIYHHSKQVSDSLARKTLVGPLMMEANELLVGYLNFANAKADGGIIHPPLAELVTAASRKEVSIPLRNLSGMLIALRNLRHNLANMHNLRLFHNRDLLQLLELLAKVERLTAREYNKLKLKTQKVT